MTKFLFLIIGTLAFVASTYAVVFSRCPNQSSEIGELNGVTVSGCTEQDQKCNLKVGTNVSFTANFTTNSDSTSAPVKVWGIINRIPIPFPIRPSDACTNYGVSCPLNMGGHYTLHLQFPVDPRYPRIDVDVRVALLDDNNSRIFCTQFPAKIKS